MGERRLELNVHYEEGSDDVLVTTTCDVTTSMLNRLKASHLVPRSAEKMIDGVLCDLNDCMNTDMVFLAESVQKCLHELLTAVPSLRSDDHFQSFLFPPTSPKEKYFFDRIAKLESHVQVLRQELEMSDKILLDNIILLDDMSRRASEISAEYCNNEDIDPSCMSYLSYIKNIDIKESIQYLQKRHGAMNKCCADSTSTTEVLLPTEGETAVASVATTALPPAIVPEISDNIKIKDEDENGCVLGSETDQNDDMGMTQGISEVVKVSTGLSEGTIDANNPNDDNSNDNDDVDIPEETIVFQSDHDYRASEDLPMSSIPSNGEPSSHDMSIDKIIKLVAPTQMQSKLRESIRDFSAKLVRNTLLAHLFDCGYFSLRCYLPDDAVKFSIFLSLAGETNWWNILSEKITKLCEDCENGSDLPNDANNKANNEESFELDSDYDVKILNALSDLSHLSDTKNSYKLRFYVNSTLVEIIANNNSDMCFLAFIEEIDKLVGKGHLFKRSMLLIRAWWVYETPSYSGITERGIISDDAFCTLMCAIFNVYYNSIDTPLQALAIFLAQYSSLDWSKHLVSVHGIIALPGPLENRNAELYYSLYEAMHSKDQLLTPDIIKRMSDYVVASEVVESIDYSRIPLTYSSEVRDKERENKYTPECFRVKGMNIVHPLCPTMNLVSISLHHGKFQHFVRELKIGASSLRECLDSVYSGELDADTATTRYFSNTCSRFGRGWKPDTPGLSAVVTTDSDSHLLENMHVDETILWDAIQYGNLLLDGRVTEAGFRLLFKDFLHEKGALPVGEIGKMLQDSTGITTLSTSLKLKFGGLKKFLEKYPEDFVIGVNHPFNPHVYLKETLQAEDVQAIGRGEIPKSVLVKFKRVQREIIRRKKAGLTVSGVGSGSPSAPITGATTNLPPNIVAVTPTLGAKPVIVAAAPMDIHDRNAFQSQRVSKKTSSNNQHGGRNRNIGADNRSANNSSRSGGYFASGLSSSDLNYNDLNGCDNYSSPPSMYPKRQQQFKRSISSDQFLDMHGMNTQQRQQRQQQQQQRHMSNMNNTSTSTPHHYDPYHQQIPARNDISSGTHVYSSPPQSSVLLSSSQTHMLPHQQPPLHSQYGQQSYQQRSLSDDSVHHQIHPSLLEDSDRMDYNRMQLNLNSPWNDSHGNMNTNIHMDMSDDSTPSTHGFSDMTTSSMVDESSQNVSFLSKILGRNL